MPGYKIVVDCVQPQLFLNKEMNSLEVDGYIWDKKEKAENVVRTKQNSKSFTDDQKKHMHVVCIDDMLTNTGKSEDNTASKGLSDDDNGEKEFAPVCPDEKDQMFDAVVSLAEKLTDYDNRRELLRKAVAREDAITLDLLHYIELTNKDDARQKQYAVLLRESRIRRRRAKDMLNVMDDLAGAASSIIFAAKWVKGTDKRSYRPRVMDPLPEETEATEAAPDENSIFDNLPSESLPLENSVPDMMAQEYDNESDSSLDAVSVDADVSFGEFMSDDERDFSGTAHDSDGFDEVTTKNEEEAVTNDSLNDCLTRFSFEFANEYKTTHKPNKKGNWGTLGDPNKVLGFARMAEEYISVISNGSSPDDAIAKLTKAHANEKRYTQIANGTGFAGKVAKSWMAYRTHPDS